MENVKNSVRQIDSGVMTVVVVVTAAALVATTVTVVVMVVLREIQCHCDHLMFLEESVVGQKAKSFIMP